ncbi:hypothetical protein [Capnocytophaga sp.]|uniref:HYC_CC_PP family protein n=1 Tax=Capnocytophaga sp. TaxID=44737 RepID=UPI0026DDAC79|nr:hypothetical protein [Capnocytophaga sp.]MDO5105558.1 hypothetical protein [Capnocytophaga sp.]
MYSNSGWALAFHYCGDEIASVSLDFLHSTSSQTDCCPIDESCCANSDEHSNCCDNQTFESSSSENKVITQIFKLTFSTFLPSETQFFHFQNTENIKSKKSTPAFYVDLNAPPLYTLYCQLVFYA